MANLKVSDVFRALNIGFGVKEEEVVANNLHGDTKVTSSSSEDVDFDVEPTKLNEESYFEFSEPLPRHEKDSISYFEFCEPLLRQENCTRFPQARYN